MSFKGGRSYVNGDIKILLEFETIKNNFDVQSEVLDKNLGRTASKVSDFTLQHIVFEKRYHLYVSAPQKEIGMLVGVIKQNENILLLNTTEIDF